MSFTDWLGLAIKKNGDIPLEKTKEYSVDMGAMASGDPAAAVDALHRVLEQQNHPGKILMVNDGYYHFTVSDFTIDTAQKHHCDIIALDVNPEPEYLSGEKKSVALDKFMETARENGERFVDRCRGNDIKAVHVMDIGDRETIIKRIVRSDPAIRYVIRKPESTEKGVAAALHLAPVLDLNRNAI